MDAKQFGGELAIANFRPSCSKVRFELLQCARAIIGKKVALKVGPDEFNRIEFGTIRG